ncbi:glycosyl transferase [Marivirga sp. S37H4]|uniref:Glycosyl transferase n=1 Tax=Marivirga aurantiaca TaxID=2802615 RepID=A0A935CAB6_9BACT|nr:glycosyltransferase family protein [Marivirga aurantiaca]MBK6266454.1 glycosyl transferase [Marivirga aurantiaca]
MKILYAIQGTGNGHISRARDIIPVLKNYGKLEILISGSQSDVDLGFPVDFQFHGLSFVFGKKGGIDFLQTFRQARIIRFFKDLISLNISQYDLVINDFEPLSAWACFLKGKQCISLSHQSAVVHPDAPKPKRKDNIGFFVLKYYAPSTSQYSFHFKPYSENIFYPIIRNSIRQMIPTKGSHYTVYLPAYSEEKLIGILSGLPAQWEVFSKHSQHEKEINNVKIYPIDNTKFIDSLSSCIGVLCGAGFEGPAEALFLRKKLMVIPMKRQYEQACNAAALEEMGIPVIPSLQYEHIAEIERFLEDSHVPILDFPNQTSLIIERIIREQTHFFYSANSFLLEAL